MTDLRTRAEVDQRIAQMAEHCIKQHIPYEQYIAQARLISQGIRLPPTDQELDSTWNIINACVIRQCQNQTPEAINYARLRDARKTLKRIKPPTWWQIHHES